MVTFNPKARFKSGSVKQVKGVLPAPARLGGAALARPSVCVRGFSGTGKTTGAAHLLAGGNMKRPDFKPVNPKVGLILAVEDKIQPLMKFDPLIIFIGAPVEEKATGAKRPPTYTEQYHRLMEFQERLGAGEYRKVDGTPIDILIGEGIMEVAKIVVRHHRLNMPRAESTGSKDARGLWLNIGEEVVDFLAEVRRAASAAAHLYGIAPLGQYWTVGEKHKDGRDELAVAGNIATDNLPYQFEATLRLSVRREVDGSKVYVCETIGDRETGVDAKVPADLPAEIVGWDMNDIYEQIIAAYQEIRTPEKEAGSE